MAEAWSISVYRKTSFASNLNKNLQCLSVTSIIGATQTVCLNFMRRWYIMPMRKTIAYGLIFISLLFINIPTVNGREKTHVPKQTINTPQVFWCAKTDGNKHIGYCFEKQKQCKDWSRKKFEENGKKLHLCRPTRL